MMQPIHFYDAATPENVPSGVYAAVYVNGFAWPESQVRRMAKVIRISVHREARWARFARVIDVERGAALPQDVVPFIHERRAHIGVHGGEPWDDATAYVNRSNHQQIIDLVDAAGIPQPRYWVATLDGTDLAGVWAVQRFGHPGFDLSVLHGRDDFHRP